MTRFNASLALSVIFPVSNESLCEISVSVGFSTVLLKTLFYFIQQVREGKTRKMSFVGILLKINIQIQSNFFLLLKIESIITQSKDGNLINLSLQYDHHSTLEQHCWVFTWV